jgi:hypothetical protein
MSRNPKQPSQPSPPSRPASDLTVHDSYLVLLHVANLVACASNIGVRPNIIRRLQQLLDEVADEYNAAVREEAELEARLDR